MTRSPSPCRRAALPVAVAAALLLSPAAPAVAIDGVGGDGVTAARDQYDSPGDASTASAGAKGAPKRPSRKAESMQDKRGDNGGVAADGTNGATNGGAGVLGDGIAGADRGDAGATQDQRQLEAGTSLPFTGWTIAPVALLGAALLAAGVVLRRRSFSR